MADDGVDVDNDDEDGEGKSVGGKKTLLIIIAVVLLLGGVGAGLFFSGIIGGGGDSAEEEMMEEAADDHGDDHGGGHAEPKLGPDGQPLGGPAYFELPEFLVNLNTGGQRTSFLKMKVTLELMGPEALPRVQAHKPRIVDAFNTYLRELRTSDLSGSAGLERLRQELMTRVNKVIAPDEVKYILFDEVIVQ